MSLYRYMRTLVFFDLPVVKAYQRREYRKFVTFLKKNGFFMLQKSVYVRMSLNQAAVDIVVDLLEKNKPSEGCVAVLTITEKQFSNIQFIIGEIETDVINSDLRFIEL